MPKAQPSYSRKNNRPQKLAVPSSSQSSPRRPRQSATDPPANTAADMSQWRASRISATRMINKTNVKRLYRLNEADLARLPKPLEEITTRYDRKQGRHVPVIMYLYYERDVERLAWELNGGPEGFEARLEELRRKYHARYPNLEFPAPDAYQPGYHNGPAVIAIPPLPPGRDRYATTSALVDLKRRMLEKSHGDEWLWKVCNVTLFERLPMFQGLSNKSHEKAMVAAVENLPSYPARTGSPQILSTSFTALKEVLSEAPIIVRSQFTGEFVILNRHNIRTDETPFPLEIWEFWSNEYFIKVFEALIRVIQEHGAGDCGWKAARWLVYDTYSQWDGIHIYPDEAGQYTAEDHAFGWLQGRAPAGSRPRWEFEESGANNPSQLAAVYNAMLPSTVD